LCNWTWVYEKYQERFETAGVELKMKTTVVVK